jgi:dolichol-phosphate mannosyltransferase
LHHKRLIIAAASFLLYLLLPRPIVTAQRKKNMNSDNLPTISIVIPAMNEADNIKPLIDEIMAIASRVPLTEIIYINDGSDDATLATLQAVKQTNPLLRILSHDRRSGQSAATMNGVRAARGDVIVTLDADGQNDPADIPSVYKVFLDNYTNKRIGMVAGQRRKRHDNWLRRVSSRIANNVRSSLLKDGVRDTGCSLKLIRRDVYAHLPYFNHMHRFLAALVRREGYEILLTDVDHRPRLRGVSKYGMMNRLWVGIVDICGVMWLQRRAGMPSRVDEIV